MKTALSLLAPIPLLVPVLGGGHSVSAGDLEQALRNQMNGSSAGQITQRVHCTRLSRSAQQGPIKYSCTLTSTKGSRGLAIVSVSDGSWRAAWVPLKG
jgi:hypothetical protein